LPASRASHARILAAKVEFGFMQKPLTG
jgi:hypothetical protein